MQALLERVASGELSAGEALEALRLLPFAGQAEVLADTHRVIRQGFPEAVYAEGKSTAQVLEAVDLLAVNQGMALATRVSDEAAAELRKRYPEGCWHAGCRIFTLGGRVVEEGLGEVAVVCAGTSDVPVAEEAAVTLAFSGVRVLRVRDVGVAGLHRLLARLEELRRCRALIVVAGMEGALPGVIGGLTRAPLVAVPTSIGYGANFAGLSALLTMLNTCAPGVTVVNIDNGYGAAVAVQRMLRGMNPGLGLKPR